jgi:GR25 family glycosyltransferase involved in LPS biosynthesis
MIKHCYYINLEKRTDRKDFIEEQLNKSEILKNIYQRFDAVDGLSIHPRSLEKNLLTPNAIEDILSDTVTAWGLSLTQGALGVLLSYKKLFSEISTLDDIVITFEDDVIIDENFDNDITEILNELPEDFDICYLGYGDIDIEKVNYSKSLSIPKGMVVCLPALIVSPKGAKKISDILTNIDHQIDTALYNNHNNLNVFVSNKKIVQIKNHLGSDIQGNNNCVKNYKKQNYIFSTLAYGENANANAIKLAIDLNHFKQKILIVTDQKELYKSLENVIIVEYPDKPFSYNDKIICFKEGFKHEDAVVYIDSDCRIFYENYKKCYTNFLRIIEPGFHPSWDWGLIDRPDSGFFDSTDVGGRVNGYGELALQTAKDLDIPISKAYHYQEGMLILSKEDNKWEVLLDTWEKMSNVLDNYEISNNSSRIGVGEGNIFGLSLAKSNMTLHSHTVCNDLGNDIKYNFYGNFVKDYIEQFPNRKVLRMSSGDLIQKNKLFVDFEDKKIELKYEIYSLNNNLCILVFSWNENNAVEFLDHEFKINDVVYHFNSDKTNEFYFDKKDKIEIYHTYDWYGNKNWELIETI